MKCTFVVFVRKFLPELHFCIYVNYISVLCWLCIGDSVDSYSPKTEKKSNNEQNSETIEKKGDSVEKSLLKNFQMESKSKIWLSWEKISKSVEHVWLGQRRTLIIIACSIQSMNGIIIDVPGVVKTTECYVKLLCWVTKTHTETQTKERPTKTQFAAGCESHQSTWHANQGLALESVITSTCSALHSTSRTNSAMAERARELGDFKGVCHFRLKGYVSRQYL